MSGLRDVNLPKDADAQPIQVLRPSTIVNVATSNSSTATPLPSGADLVEIAVTEDAYIEFGLTGTTAASSSSMFFPKGVAVYRVPIGATHLAHIRDTTNGRISITKLI